MTRPRGRAVATAVALIALLLGACDAGTPASSVLTPDPDATPAPAPPTWSYLGWSDPDLELALPPDWTAEPPQRTDPASGTTEVQRRNIAWSNALIDSGSARTFFFGSLRAPQGDLESGAVFVIVESRAEDLDGFVDRSIGETQTLVPGTSVAHELIVLPAGVGARLTYAGHIDDWPGFSAADYLFRLADGRSLTISFSGTEEANDPAIVLAFSMRAIATLRPATR